MVAFLRFLMLLALAIWLGALVFFPFVAQTAFTVLPLPHLAGLVVRDTLGGLHWLGLLAGSVFVGASLIIGRIATGRARPFRLAHILVVAMLALTAISQFEIIPRMERLRTAAGEISSLPGENPIRAQFDSLHAWSTRIEGTVLVLGVFVLYLTSRRLASERS